MRLVYNGPQPVSFVSLGIELSPGEEFDVSDAEAESFLPRLDVEEVLVTVEKPRKKFAEEVPVAEVAVEEVPSSDQGTGTDTVEG